MSTVCASCGREYPDARPFCGQCGARLGSTCGACGAANGPEERFCRDCGAPLSAAPPEVPARSPSVPTPAPPPALHEPEGERKQLTVLFADVQGSMELQEDLDVEAWARIVDRFVHILAEGVRRYGGTVDKFTGDGIMALFGAPEAQEDHARRACHAAWQMSRAIRAYAEELRQSEGVNLHVRIGLNSGEAVVGRVGEDLRIDPTALGHTVGLAQRMEALAVPGCAYLTEHTARLAEDWFRLRSLGPMTVKGAREQLEVFVLEGPAPPRSAARGGRVTSRMVGRAAEMARLEEALSRAAEGHAQVVGVVGEPGVGKSRLCDEFSRSMLARGISVRRAAGVSHGREVPLLPILAYFRDYFAITDADTPAQARERITDRLLALDPAFRDDLSLFFDFLEVPDPEYPAPQLGAEARLRRVFEVLRRVTARRSEQELAVLVWEDLHWFDPQSEAFLARLIENFPGSRTLVVTNFRPEFSAVWMRHSYYQQISLQPLTAEPVAEMVRDLLGDDPSLAPLAAYLVERTGGNPFFVEEVVRALIEDGTLSGEAARYRLTRPLEHARLPASVQSVLAARIDRLSAEHKPVLQSASVIGRTFAEAVLARVMGKAIEALPDALTALCSAELLQEWQRYPVAEYRFWHPLTQEVAYGTLLTSRRARLHAAVAEALIEHDADRLDEEAAVVAWHWERAGRRLEAARWTMRAADFALRSDLDAAVSRWRAAIDLLDSVEESAESMTLGVRSRMRLIRWGARTGMDPRVAESVVARGRELAERLGDRRRTGAMALAAGTSSFFSGELLTGRDLWVEAARLGQEAGDRDLVAGGGFPAAWAYWCVGPLSEGLHWTDRALEACDDDPDVAVGLMGYGVLGCTLAFRANLLAHAGRLVDAEAQWRRSLSIVRTRAEPEQLCWTLAFGPYLAWLAGHAGTDSDAVAQVPEAVKLAEETGNVAALVMALEGSAVAHLTNGQSAEATAACEQALAVAREKRSGLMVEASLLAYLALARLGTGALDDAAVAADEAVEVARRRGAQVHECLALLARARVVRSRGGPPDVARADLLAALALIEETGARTYEPFIREELGKLTDDRAELQEAERLYGTIGATGHERRLEDELTGSAPVVPSHPA